MCGIAGYVGRSVDGLVERMAQAMQHRGPDDQGLWTDRALGVHLGFRRLAIIDIDGGHQPMWNEDDTVGVVFNGEIYNHGELRTELIRLGHVFRSDHSDTEVLVHGYEAWGDELPRRLNGMFAFAVLDRTQRRILLARDRFGEKPLYWARTRDGLGFASELSVVALHPDVSTTLDVKVVQKYFAHGFVPGTNCILRGVRKLGAGSLLSYDIDTRTIKERIYWRFRIEPDESLGPDDDARVVDELRQRLLTAVRRRLISDVPLGIFLSGGVDSSAVLAFARMAAGTADLKTFNVGFNEPSYDESQHAREVARHFGASHASEILDLSSAAQLLSLVLGRVDEPLADPSIIPTYLLARFTRRHVTVALSGDGGDELFAGYDPFSALAPACLYSRWVPRFVHLGIRKLADMLPYSPKNMSFDFKVRRALLGLSFPQSLWNPVWLSPMSPDLIRELFEAPMSPDDLYSEVLTQWNADSNLSLIDKTLEFYTNFYLVDDILTKVDRASMMNSLESRAVLLDNDLVEYVRRLPAHFKIRNGQRKSIFREAIRDLVPATVLDRPKKGFGIPLVTWLRDLAEMSRVPFAGLDTARLNSITRAQKFGQSDERLAIWAWLALRARLDHAGQLATAAA